MMNMTPELRAERFEDLQIQLNSLISRGMQRRAADICLDIIDVVDTHGQRQKYAQLRAMLIRKSNAARSGQQSQSWYLAGQFNGGEL